MSRSKRKQEGNDLGPSYKKQKIGSVEAFNVLSTYADSAIKNIIKNANNLKDVQIEEIEGGFTLIRPNCFLIKLNEKKRFILDGNKYV